MSDRDLLLPSEVARVVGLTAAGVRAAADRGDLRALTTASGWRLFERSEVERFKAERDERGGSRRRNESDRDSYENDDPVADLLAAGWRKEDAGFLWGDWCFPAKENPLPIRNALSRILGTNGTWFVVEGLRKVGPGQDHVCVRLVVGPYGTRMAMQSVLHECGLSSVIYSSSGFLKAMAKQ
jgi:hypothetical protein